MAETGEGSSRRPRRPVLVSVILVSQVWITYLLLTRFFWPLLLYRIGAPQLSDAQRTFFSGLSPSDLLATTIVIVGFTAGGVALFFLKKAALYIFVTALGSRAVFALARVPSEGLSDALGTGDLSTVLAWGLPTGLCLYCWRLVRKRILT